MKHKILLELVEAANAIEDEKKRKILLSGAAAELEAVCLVSRLRRCLPEQRKEAALLLARTGTDTALAELARMANGGRIGLFRRYSFDDRAIGIEALAETGMPEAKKFLLAIGNYERTVVGEAIQNLDLRIADPKMQKWLAYARASRTAYAELQNAGRTARRNKKIAACIVACIGLSAGYLGGFALRQIVPPPAHNRTLAELKEANSALNLKDRELENQKSIAAKQKTEIMRLEKELSDYISDVSQKKTELEGAKSRIGEMEKYEKMLSQSLRMLTEEVGKYKKAGVLNEAKISDLTAKLENAEQQARSFNAELTGAKKSIQQKDAELAQADKQAKTSKKLIDDMAAAAKNYESAIKQKNLNIEVLTAENKKNDEALQKLRGQWLDYEKRMKASNEQLAKQVMELEIKTKYLSDEAAQYKIIVAKYDNKEPRIPVTFSEREELLKYRKTLEVLNRGQGLISYSPDNSNLIPFSEWKACRELEKELDSENADTYDQFIKESKYSLKGLTFNNVSHIEASYSKSLFVRKRPVRLDSLSKLPNLESIKITGAEIQGSVNLSNLPLLKLVNLSGCTINDFTKSRNLPALDILVLSGCTINSLAGIENITVQGIYLDNADIKSIEHIFNSNSLQYISLLNTKIPGVNGFTKMPALKLLIIAGSQFNYTLQENQDAMAVLKQKGVRVVLSGHEYNEWLNEQKANGG